MYYDDELYHVGKPHDGHIPHSGRYPFGSGEEPFQRDTSFRAQVAQMRAKGVSDTDIAKSMGLTTSEFRKKITLEKNAEVQAMRSKVAELYDKGYSKSEIGRQLGINESLVRNYLNEKTAQRTKVLDATTDMLRKSMKEHEYLDVGVGVERELNISRQKLDAAIEKLKDEGYTVENIYVPQVTNPNRNTTVKVLCKEGTDVKELYNNLDKIDSIKEYVSRDGGQNYLGIQYQPENLDSKRVLIRYKEEGGEAKDGVIELRPGVEDISLGNSHYAQVRIAVDGTHYLKGMAMYSDKIPDGYDVVFNTNKKQGTPPEKVFKELKLDADGNVDKFNPFGATIKANGQRWYTDPETGEKKLSVINKVNEEGDWGEWSKTISSQMLSKQSYQLVKQQLDLSYKEKMDEFKDIMKVSSPEAREKLLESFADDCDSTAVELKAVGFPNQRAQVILPIPELKDTEVYAPNYKNGEHVALVRYPHGGIFEIPELVVNNKHPVAKKILGSNPIDCIGINKNVADRLSGADFDGDTVQVIPISSKVKISTAPPLKGLIGFDPKAEYPEYPGMAVIKPQTKQTEMGKVSNLITDMTLRGGYTEDEITRAIKHSMVVIDSEKHHLDYRRSEKENGIAELKAKFQPKDPVTGKGGASTIISRAGSEERLPRRKETLGINERNTDPETGERIHYTIGGTWTDKEGKVHEKTTISTRMAETKDAYTLSSGTRKEDAYAKYANQLKSLANEARKEYLAAGKTKYDASAKDAYKSEVDSLRLKLNEALKNAPKERQAQMRATQAIRAIRKDNPGMDKKEEKKKRSQALAVARTNLGAGKKSVLIFPTDREWDAMMSGAVSSNVLTSIFTNMQEDEVRKRALPDYSGASSLNSTKVARLKALSNAGYTNAEVADALGISISTVSKYLKE